MAKVFISYSSRDAHFANEVYTALETAGHEVWMDRKALEPGAAWLKAIQDNIQWADSMIVVWSANALESLWVMEEVRFAYAKGKQIIPIQIDDIDSSEHIIIHGRQIIDARELEFEQVMAKAGAALKHGFVPPDKPDATEQRPRNWPPRRRLGVIGGVLVLVLIGLGLMPFVASLTDVPVTEMIPSATPDHVSLEALNQWLAENSLPVYRTDSTLHTLADRHMRDLRSRPLSAPFNEYRDLDGRDITQMAAEAGYPGTVEMAVRITDEPLQLGELVEEMVKRGGDEVHTLFSEAGFAWVQSQATEKYYYVLVLGQR